MRLDIDDWRLSDRNPFKVAAVAALALVLLIGLALNLSALSLIHRSHSYSAYLANASGLTDADTVQIRGVRIGKVDRIRLIGNRVRVDFSVNRGVDLGDRTSARVKVLNPLGSEYLELAPAGSGRLEAPIPLDRTQVSRTLVTQLGTLSDRVEKVNLEQLRKALDIGTSSLSGTSHAAVTKALTGLNDFAGTLAEDADSLTALVHEGSALTKTINSHSGDLVNLVNQGDALVSMLKQRQAAIKQLISSTSRLSAQVASILHLNQAKLTPMLRNLREISAALAKQNDAIGKAVPALADLADSVARVTGTGPFADVVVPGGIIPNSISTLCGHPPTRYPAPKNPKVGCRP